ncbi:MAG: hypothetical protein IBJ10_02240 [Phycisphaerales bacterium]|nr:hypothetical protein [Phycisphaerales bacterium]
MNSIRITLLIAAAAGALFFMTSGAGCAIRTTSPYTGEPATADQISLQADRAMREAQKAAETELAKTTADAQRRRSAYESAIATLDATTQLQITDLNREFNDFLAETALKTQGIQASLDRTMGDIVQARDVAHGEIQLKAETLTAGIGMVSSSPAGANPLVAGLLGVVTVGLGLSQAQASARKREADAREDERKRAEAIKSASDGAWDESKNAAMLQATQMLLLALGGNGRIQVENVAPPPAPAAAA